MGHKRVTKNVLHKVFLSCFLLLLLLLAVLYDTANFTVAVFTVLSSKHRAVLANTNTVSVTFKL